MTEIDFRRYQLQIEAASLLLEGNPYSRYLFGQLTEGEILATRRVRDALKGFSYSARRRILCAAWDGLDAIVDPTWVDEAGEVPSEVIRYWDHGRWPGDDAD